MTAFAALCYVFAWFFLGAPDFDLHDYRAAVAHLIIGIIR